MSQKKQGQNKSEKEGGKQRAIKNQIEKRRKGNKTLSQKSEKGRKKLDKKAIKKKEPKIKVLTHELSALTLSYLMLAHTPFLQISLHRLLPCQVWSSYVSLLIIGSSYYPITNWCLRRPPLDMSKPSQAMLHELLLNWCHP
jgi:hypothetical protein